MAEDGSDQIFRWRILRDRAVSSSKDDLFGQHSTFATLLYDLAENCETPFTVGLYGGWGMGKSSVAGILQERIFAESPQHFGYVYLDVWKYSSDPLKRWTLLETEKQLREQHILDEPYTFDERTLESHLEFEEQWEEEAKIGSNSIFGPSVQRLVWLATILCGSATAALAVLIDKIPPALRVLAPLMGILAGAGLLGTALTPVLNWLMEYLKKIAFRRIQWYRTAKPAFSSEKFGAIFHDMISKACQKLPARKLIVVFDNLDRCPESVAVEAIAVIKTYLDVPGCVYVVPCDQAALVRHVARSYTQDANEESSTEYAKEYLNKFFQMTLRLPPPMDYDLESFIDKQLKLAGMEDLPREARDVLVLGYRGETPRQVKRILNDLVGYLALGAEAERNKLLAQGELTSNLAFLTKMAIISANWPEFLERVAANPELWSDINSRLQQAGYDIDGLVPEKGAADFLRRTRYVSAEADVRPYLYIKRAPYEQDALLRTRVETSLRNGDIVEFEKILANSERESKLNDVLDITGRAVRNWRETLHTNFVMNASPIIVSTAVKYGSYWPLRREALSVLEFVSGITATQKLAPLFDPRDVFALVADATPNQRRIIATKYASLLSVGASPSISPDSLFRQFLTNRELLDHDTKSTVRETLSARYNTDDSEIGTLHLLTIAAEAPNENVWAVDPKLLENIASKIEYTNMPVDALRLRVLSGLESALTPQAKAQIISRIAQIIPASPITAPPTQLTVFGDALRQFRPNTFTDVGIGLDNLVAQFEGHAVQDKPAWIRPLLTVYPGMAESSQARIVDTFRKSALEGTDPQVLSFLGGLDENDWTLLFTIPETQDTLRAEPEALERIKGISKAPGLRQQHLDTIPLRILAATPAIYDSGRTWDVVLEITNIDRALASGAVEVDGALEELTSITKRAGQGDPTTNRPIYEAVCKIVETRSDLIDTGLADEMANWATMFLETKAEVYPVFRICLAKLTPDKRIEKMELLVDHCLVPPRVERALLLPQVIVDVCSDSALCGDEALVRKLFDVAYKETTEHLATDTTPLLQLSEQLSSYNLANYLDRTIERLSYLEAGNASTAEMEPSLQLVIKHWNKVSGEMNAKLERFLGRMLSPASDKLKKLRALDLLIEVTSPALIQSLGAELDELARSEDQDVVAKVDPLRNR